jgi:hypothetical protein
MRSIYKYELNGTHLSAVDLPKGANVVKFDSQNGKYCIWALVDPESPKEVRYFTVVGTGWDIDDTDCYIGTIQEGSFVWHCLEVSDEA